MKRAITGVSLLVLFLSVFHVTYAETDVVKEVTNFAKGTAGVKSVKDIDGNLVGDVAIKATLGDIPSLTMVNLLNQVEKDFWAHSDQASNQTRQDINYTQCQRAANAKAWSVLRDIQDEGKLKPWVNIAWGAIKGAASGGATVTELIAKHTKAKLQEKIKSWLNTSSTLPKEKVVTDFSSNCNAHAEVVWDPQLRKIKIDISGDCGCTEVKTGTGSISLNRYSVHIEAPVKVSNVTLENKNPFIFWRDSNVQVEYKIGSLQVVSNATCGEKCPIDPPPLPPEDPEDETGWVGGVVGWIVDLFKKEDKVEDPEDEVGEEENDESEECEEGDTECEDKNDEEGEEEDKDDTEEQEEDKPAMCRANVDIDGRSDVPTYKTEITSSGTYFCGGNCGYHQLCQNVVSQSVVSGSCTYCKNVCEEGQFRHENDCLFEKEEDEKCVITGYRNGGRCYGIEKDETYVEPVDEIEEPQDTTVSSGGNCEGAIRKVLDDYLGWFDPNLSVGASNATFTVDEHRCFSEDEFETHHRGLIKEGVADPAIKAMCPSLKHISSNENLVSGTPGTKGAICVSKSEFSF